MHISDRARELHERAIIVDAHNDTLVLRLSRGEHLNVTERDERYHVDVPRALEGGLTCSFFMLGSGDLDQAMKLVDATWRLADEHPEQVIYVTSTANIERAKDGGALAVVGQLESCTCLNGSLATLRNLYRLGVRVANLTHGEGGEGTTQQKRSLFDYCAPADRDEARELPGLTDFGRRVIAECNRLGMVVDLAHASDATFYEAIELCETPPIFSHGAVFSQCPHWRGLTDDQIRALAEARGVLGMAFHPLFIDRDAPSMERLMDSIEHVVELVGPDHIGIGADYDGMPETAIPIPPAVERLPEFTEALVEQGFDDETILKVLGGNFMRVLREVVG
ncbi:MAG: membrane dipeptidase [Armatimonadota bacterium]|nr:membrane dipeptidase [Armatimonadota bacterium]